MTTTYGKNLGFDGSSGRQNHVRGQYALEQFRPRNLEQFRPFENLSSKTFAPNGNGGEVPLNYENTNGDDPRAIPITNETRVNPKQDPGQYNFNNLGSYPGQNIDQYMFNFANENPTFSQLFHQFKPRM